MSSNSRKLLVIIVNYRTANLTIDCLQSLEPEIQSLANTQVIVVDNNSRDDSVEQIQTAINTNAWSKWVTLIASSHNGGYAYGNNLAIRPALASANPPNYILLLNPDTYIRPGACKNLLEFMDKHPDVGIAGSRLEDPDKTPQRSAFRFHSVWSELDSGLRLGIVSNLLKNKIVAPPVPDIASSTDWVSGASMIIRREVFDAIGIMDEDYFMYYEEVDFCLQAQRAGWNCWYVPESRVVHLVGQSSGITNTKQLKRRPQYWFDSRRRFFTKNYGWGYLALADSLWLFGYLLWSIRQLIGQKPNNDPPQFLADFWQNSIFRQPKLESEPKTDTSQSLTLGQQIKEDWIAHGKDWTLPGFRAIAVQRFGVWRMKIEPKLLRAPFSILYRSLYRFVRNVYGIELPYTVQLGRRVIIEHQHGIVIHGHSVIGDDCIIRQGVTIGNRYLESPLEAPKLGARVNIGTGAKILGNVTIADDVNIGANAVVLVDIPSGKTAVGIPAKIL